MRVSQRDREEDVRCRQKIKERPNLKLQAKRRKSTVNPPHTSIHEAAFSCCMKYMCGTESVEIKAFKGTFLFLLYN